MAVNEEQLQKFVSAYDRGESYINIGGTRYNIHDPKTGKIFSFKDNSLGDSVKVLRK
jgi:hypothetical protein